MRQLVFILVGLFPLTALGQGEIPTESDLRAKVADVAALAVRNTDDLASLRDRVAGLEGKLPSLESRIEQLENRVFEVVTPSIPPVALEVVAGPVLYSPPVVPVVPVVQAAPVVRQAPVRQTARRTRLRPIFRFLLFRRVRSRANVTTVSSSRSGSWTWPGNLASHLSGFHGVNVAGLSQSQMIQIHDSIHDG